MTDVTLNEARVAVQSRLLNNLPAAVGARVVLDNEDRKDLVAPWLRATVRHTARTPSTLGVQGNRRFRSSASLFVQVYTEVNTGLKSADDLAQAILDLFEGESFDGVSFTAGIPRETGPSGKYDQTVVELPFDYDEIK